MYNENGNYEYYQMNQVPQEPQEPQQPKEKKDYTRAKKLAKKVGALVLAGVLVGGSAGLAFQGVTYAAGGSENEKSTSSTATLQTAAPVSDGTINSESLDVSDIADSVMPSIVAITNQSVQEVQDYFSMFGMGGIPQEEEVESAGSGIIVGQNDEELLIVSNNHVVEGADTLSVCFNDGNVYEASIKGTDSDRDLAVIAVKLSDISDDTMASVKAIQIGSSDDLKVGEQVVAIGNALGYGQSVTTGIVSALDRTLEDGSDATFIQTDAAINPGNSGGALLNMQGQLIGINSAKYASTEVEGMGYAIPVSEVQEQLENLMNRTTREKVEESKSASLGVSVQDVDSQVSEMYGLPEGAYVAEVTKGSAAEKAGLKEGYIITGFDGESVSSVSDLQNLMQYYAAGEEVEVTYQVSDGGQYKEQKVTVTLDQAQAQTVENR